MFDLPSVSIKSRKLDRALPLSTPPDLPCEILQEIFRALLESLHDNHSERGLGLISASHVSQLWRQAALGDPSLWAKALDPHCLNPQQFDEILKRSRQSPLNIEASTLDLPTDYAYRFASPQWLALYAQMHRIQKLHLVINDSPASDISKVDEILSNSAPILESLDISFRTSKVDQPNYVYSPFFTLNPQVGMFHGQAPHLRHLVLHNCGLEFPIGCVFENLHTFEMYSQAGEMPCSFASFAVSCAKTTPSLVNLQIHGVARCQYNSTRVPSGAFPPSLKQFELSGWLSGCLCLLAALEPPPATCAVSLSVEVRDGVSRHDTDKLVYEASRIWNQCGSPCLNVDLTMDECLQFMLDLSWKTHVIRLNITHRNVPEVYAPFFNDFFRSLSHHNHFPYITPFTVLELDVCAHEKIIRTTYEDSFMGLMAKFSPIIQTLCLGRLQIEVTDKDLPPVLDLFRVDPNRSDGTVLFPSVKWIRIDETVTQPAVWAAVANFAVHQLRRKIPMRVEFVLREGAYIRDVLGVDIVESEPPRLVIQGDTYRAPVEPSQTLVRRTRLRDLLRSLHRPGRWWRLGHQLGNIH